jgi:hypothetical protein
MEAEGSPLHSHKPATDLRPEPDDSSPQISEILL